MDEPDSAIHAVVDIEATPTEIKQYVIRAKRIVQLFLILILTLGFIFLCVKDASITQTISQIKKVTDVVLQEEANTEKEIA